MIFIDLHGVLVDFIGQVEKVTGIDIYSDTKNHGDWHAPSKVIPDFRKIIDSQPIEFWETMPILEDGVEMLNGYGRNCVILTTPWGNGASYVGTDRLIRKFFPDVPHMFAHNKHCIATGNMLIDDKDENVNAWIENRGRGILYPRIWNSGFKKVLGV